MITRPDEGQQADLPPRPMITGFDHAVIAVRDLDSAAARFRQLGFEIAAGGPYVGIGTRNAFIRFGLASIELQTVESEPHAASTNLAGPPLLDLVHTREASLAGYALAIDNIDRAAAQLGRTGLSGFTGLTPEGPFLMKRRAPDGSDIAWRVMLVGGAAWRRPWPMLVQWDTPDKQRLGAEPPGAHPNGITGIRGIAVAVANLDTAASIYQEHLGLPPGESGDVPALGARGITYHVGTCEIHLLTPAGEGRITQILGEMGEGPFELTLAARDVERTRRALAEAGVTLTPHPTTPGALVIPPEQTLGVRLALAAEHA